MVQHTGGLVLTRWSGHARTLSLTSTWHEDTFSAYTQSPFAGTWIAGISIGSACSAHSWGRWAVLFLGHKQMSDTTRANRVSPPTVPFFRTSPSSARKQGQSHAGKMEYIKDQHIVITLTLSEGHFFYILSTPVQLTQPGYSSYVLPLPSHLRSEGGVVVIACQRAARQDET